jgi:hypothetical protein
MTGRRVSLTLVWYVSSQAISSFDSMLCSIKLVQIGTRVTVSRAQLLMPLNWFGAFASTVMHTVSILMPKLPAS